MGPSNAHLAPKCDILPPLRVMSHIDASRTYSTRIMLGGDGNPGPTSTIIINIILNCDIRNAQVKNLHEVAIGRMIDTHPLDLPGGTFKQLSRNQISLERLRGGTHRFWPVTTLQQGWTGWEEYAQVDQKDAGHWSKPSIRSWKGNRAIAMMDTLQNSHEISRRKKRRKQKTRKHASVGFN